MIALGIVLIILELGAVIGYIALFYIKKMELTKKDNRFLIPVFLLIFIVYSISLYHYNKDSGIYEYVCLVPKAIKFFVFDISTDYAGSISKAHPIYYGVYAGLMIIVALSWVTAISSIFVKKIKNTNRLHKALKNNCDIVVGYSKDSLKYISNYPNSVVWLEQNEKKIIEELRIKKIGFVINKLTLENIDKKIKVDSCHLIFFKDTKPNLLDLVSSFSSNQTLKHQIYLHFETSLEEMKFIRDKYLDLKLENQQIYLSCFNKHELLAREFVKLYPISKYIPRDFYNSNFTIKEDKEINICFVGFGRVNISLFKLMAIEFQFAKENKNQTLASKPVHFYAFDADEGKLHNEYFTKLKFDYFNSFRNCDFPRMDKICDLDFEKSYAESAELKAKFRDLVRQNSFTYFIISLGNDSENTGYADALFNALEEYRDYFRIFSRVKDNKIIDINKSSDCIIYFGEDRNFLSHDRIINEDLMKLAGMVNKQYLNISATEFYKKWQNEPIIEQYSNIYSALNIYHKCALMGLEFVPSNDSRRALPKQEFEAIYGSTDEQKNDEFYKKHYEFYRQNTVKNTLAFIEHARWNATYFLFDYKQMKIDDFPFNEQKNRFEHKDTVHKKHACLTTYDALDTLIKVKYQKLKEQKNQPTNIKYDDPDFIEAANIYRYDYMMMDALYHSLEDLNYKIVYLKEE